MILQENIDSPKILWKSPKVWAAPVPEVFPKSPRMLPPSPPRILRFFGDFPPKIPEILAVPHPRSVPETVEKCVPIPIPEFWGFSGTGMIFPLRFKLSPSPNCPQTPFKGYPRGSPGIPEVQQPRHSQSLAETHEV